METLMREDAANPGHEARNMMPHVVVGPAIPWPGVVAAASRSAMEWTRRLRFVMLDL